jgi:hypothetical protein
MGGKWRRENKQRKNEERSRRIRWKVDISVFLFLLFLKPFCVAYDSRFTNSECMGGQLTFLNSRWQCLLCQRHLAVGGIYYIACGRPVDCSPLKRKNSYRWRTVAFLNASNCVLNEAEATSRLEVRLLLRTPHGGGVTPISVCIDLSIAHVTSQTNKQILVGCLPYDGPPPLIVWVRKD